MKAYSRSSKKIYLEQINHYHPKIKHLSSKISELIYLQRFDVLSASAIEILFHLHPICLLKNNNSYYVIAGFRSYQLAIIYAKPKQKIPCEIYKDISDDEILHLAEVDLLGSTALHSLGTSSVKQLNILKNILQETESVAPGLSSVRSRTKFEKLP